MLSTALTDAAHAVAGAGLAPLTGPGAGPEAQAAAGANFVDLINGALTNVSADQKDAAVQEAGVAAAAPGANLGRALVASDRAEVAWNATVAVRNEVVTAYQSIMNMQF
jgi:flagellar hook-basal body complex protein FliE